ncbi:MAG: HNH endonuclease [Gammaproteobacteria bacterium]|nr:HNH endonuclease [Gammaproteobacteria bacterium]
MKLVNFASLDPVITSSGRKGLKGASKGDREIWNEFHSDWDKLALESNLALSNLSPTIAVSINLPELEALQRSNFEGKTKRVNTEVRVRQAFFRKAVMASYESKCCISAIAEPKLLIASHIVPWSEDKANRLNPRNGLCLSALHDRAFDLGLISVSLDFRVLVSRRIKKHTENSLIQSAICKIEGASIMMA